MSELPTALDCFPAMQLIQLRSSFNALIPYLPAVHCEHELTSEKETNGLDMKEPTGQQP